MRETTVTRAWIWLSVLCATVSVLFAATERIGAQTAQLPKLSQIEVYLVRQDWSDCTNSTVSNAEGPQVEGIASVVRNLDSTAAVKIAMTASPNTKYHVFLKCVRQIGDLTTGDEGTGIQSFSFPTNLVGNVFAFDIYPEAPLGNKFQSVQVKFE